LQLAFDVTVDLITSRGSLVQPGDPQELCAAILRALDEANADYGSVPTWNSSCDVFEHALKGVID
jgi:hypothetical protein